MRLAKGELLFVTPSLCGLRRGLRPQHVAASPASTPIGGEMIGTITYKNHFAERKSSALGHVECPNYSSPVYNGEHHPYDGEILLAVLHLDKQAYISLG